MQQIASSKARAEVQQYKIGTTIMSGRFSNQDKNDEETVALFADGITIAPINEEKDTIARFEAVMRNSSLNTLEKCSALQDLVKITEDFVEKVIKHNHTIIAVAGPTRLQANLESAIKDEQLTYDELLVVAQNAIKHEHQKHISGGKYFHGIVVLASPVRADKLWMDNTMQQEDPCSQADLRNQRCFVAGFGQDLAHPDLVDFFQPAEGEMRAKHSSEEAANKIRALMAALSEQEGQSGARITGIHSMGYFVAASGVEKDNYPIGKRAVKAVKGLSKSAISLLKKS